jgi:uncharacterized protein YhjY with autotransporter beta-barrel domain
MAEQVLPCTTLRSTLIMVFMHVQICDDNYLVDGSQVAKGVFFAHLYKGSTWENGSHRGHQAGEEGGTQEF